MASFDDIERSVAEDYAKVVIGQHNARLWDLARLMADTGGPLSEMDASLDSLVPFWAWYRRFLDANLPGIPTGAKAAWSMIPALVSDQPDLEWRTSNADEAATHYTFEVVHRLYPSARWALLEDPGSSDHQSTGVQVGDRPNTFRSTTALGRNIGRTYLEWPDLLGDNKLREIVELNFFQGKIDPPAPTGVSILTPLLGMPRPDDSPAAGPVPVHTRAPARRVSKARAAREAAANRTREPAEFGGEYVLAAPGAFIDDLEHAHPLPTRDIARILNDHGYSTENGRAITTRSLADGHTELVMPESSTVDLSLLIEHGKLRAVFADVIGPEGTGILTELHNTAPHLGARLRPADHLPTQT